MIGMTKLLISVALSFWVQLKSVFKFIFCRAIIVTGYVDNRVWVGIRHRNWGDDLNYYLINKLVGRPIIFYHSFKFAHWLNLKNYLCIGTLLDATNYSNSQTIVWGTGVSGQERTFIHPNNILAVRGPKTKEFCNRYNVPCPETFGDPALLLPLVYKPTIKQKKYKLGIIPHVVDFDQSIINKIRNAYQDIILIIDFANYKYWTDIIDQICSCERILSSSLHGLITSDAYQVPSCWIEISGNISGGYFKFYDYASSVGRIFNKPYRLNEEVEILNIPDMLFGIAKEETVSVIQESLIKVSPFKLKVNQ